ncbi:AAA family ATPase, putative [Plasmodium gallinaceum]|uniref:AAA family ATPase, putative n=1 Tax=Plasmodium gallinaceum TaxID=5849 RepID=A0A1J1GP88_PLAGA|nr:AAA family ATPase, putative [Plasmodium gallinaceum]CRG93095.1 AAA family ATPase, putative [Plasmodium gallinaceum]
MKTKNDRKTNIEQVMSDYLISLSHLYKDKNMNAVNLNENNEKKIWKPNNFKMELIKKDVFITKKDDSNDLLDLEKSILTYYEEIMNCIFTDKEKDIYTHIKRIIKNEKNYSDIESNEYLYCYLFILAIKKMFHDLLLEKKMEQNLKIHKSTKITGENEMFYHQIDKNINNNNNNNNNNNKISNNSNNNNNSTTSGNNNNSTTADNNNNSTTSGNNNNSTTADNNNNSTTFGNNIIENSTTECEIDKNNIHLYNVAINNVDKNNVNNNEKFIRKKDKNVVEDNYDNKNYFALIFDKLKNNKSYWLIPLSVVSCIYIYYKMRTKVSSLFYNYYNNISKYFSNLFICNNEKVIFKEYSHFFNNINKHNIKRIIFNPTNNTFSYLLNNKISKNTNLIGNNGINNNGENNNIFAIYYNDYIMKYLLKNKFYENIEIILDEKVLKLPFFETVKRNLFDIVTYSFSILTFYYIYEKNISTLKVDYSFEKKEKIEALNEIILNDETKKEIKSILFFLLYPKIFEDSIICNTILLCGETGTGKSLLAKTIAKELNFDFLHLSGSSFIELYIGNGASKIRNLFKKAKKKKKCIVIFIDEIDSVGLSRNMNDVCNQNQEYTQTLNQLLIEIDSLHEYNNLQLLYENNKRNNIFNTLKKLFLEKVSNENENNLNEKDAYEIFQYYVNNNLSLMEVEEIFNLKKYRRESFILFIGATNRYKMLDTALVRSKRFDKIIYFHLPNFFTRKRLFEFYIEKYTKKRNNKINNNKIYNNSIENNRINNYNLFKYRLNNNFSSIHFSNNQKYKNLFKLTDKIEDYPSYIDTFTLSILTFMFNCADIDQLIYSSRLNILTKNNFNKIYSINNIIMENVNTLLHKKFSYDNHLEKIFYQTNYDDLNSSFTKLYNFSDVDYDNYLSKFLNYCNNALEKKIHEDKELTFDDFLFFYDFKQMKIKLWEDNINILQNNLCMNNSYAHQNKEYQLCLLWKAIESFFINLYINYKNVN